MIDGLALGETTPGPPIMVVAFVGFLGGVSQAVLGPDAAFASGAVAAGIALLATAALFRFKFGVLPVLGASALLGLGATLLR